MKLLIFLSVILLSLSCGTERVTYRDAPSDGGGGDPGGGGGSGGGDPGGGGNGGGKPSYAEVQGLLNNYCASCHANANFMKSERGLRDSSVKQRVQNRSMPPNANALPEEERKLMLAFF